MRSILLLFTLFSGSLLFAQNPIDFKKIDSLAGVISGKAANGKHKVVKGSLLLEGNQTSSIRFHLNEGRTEMIVVESDMKDKATLYFFNDDKLIYVANFANGDYNEIESSYYFIDNSAYKKEKSGFKKVGQELFMGQVSSYFDLFKDQLKE